MAIHAHVLFVLVFRRSKGSQRGELNNIIWVKLPNERFDLSKIAFQNI
jgi:hypothetical protein